MNRIQKTPNVFLKTCPKSSKTFLSFKNVPLWIQWSGISLISRGASLFLEPKRKKKHLKKQVKNLPRTERWTGGTEPSSGTWRVALLNFTFDKISSLFPWPEWTHQSKRWGSRGTNWSCRGPTAKPKSYTFIHPSILHPSISVAAG